MSQTKTEDLKKRLHFLSRTLPLHDEPFMRNMPRTKIKDLQRKLYLNPWAVLVLMHAFGHPSILRPLSYRETHSQWVLAYGLMPWCPDSDVSFSVDDFTKPSSSRTVNRSNRLGDTPQRKSRCIPDYFGSDWGVSVNGDGFTVLAEAITSAGNVFADR